MVVNDVSCKDREMLRFLLILLELFSKFMSVQPSKSGFFNECLVSPKPVQAGHGCTHETVIKPPFINLPTIISCNTAKYRIIDPTLQTDRSRESIVMLPLIRKKKDYKVNNY